MPSLSPSTVNPRPSTIAKLLDFGLARSVGDTANLTQSGMILGTPAYMAPEQARGETVDARADLFSLGCVLYRMLTGQSAFGGKDVMATLMSLATHDPPAPQTIRAEVPSELSDLVMQLLAKNRDARPTSAREVIRRMGTPARPALAVDEKRTGRSAHPTKRCLISAAAAAACILCAVIVITLKNKDGSETKITVEAPDGTKLVSVEQKTADEAGAKQAPAAPTQPVATAASTTEKLAAPKASITLAALDRAKIPESERFDWQPDDLVAVVGSHRLRDWARIGDVAFHPSGDFFVSSTPYGSSQVWSAKTLERLAGSGDPGFPEGVNNYGQCFTPDGKSFCTWSGKYSVDLSDPDHPIFRLLGKRPLHKIESHRQSVISPDGRWHVMAGNPGGVLEVWDIAGDVPRFVKEVVYSARSSTMFLSSSKDGRRLALLADGPAEAPKLVILMFDVDWKAPDGPTLTPFGEPIPGFFGGSGCYAALSPDGQKLIKTEVGGTKSQILDLSVSPPRVEFECERGEKFQFSPDGNWLAISSNEIILLKKTATGWEERSRLPTTDSSNCNLWFSLDGKTLIAAEYNAGVMRAWDLTANPPIDRFPSRHYRAIEFSPDGRLLAAAGGEANTVWKLDGATPQQIAELGTGTHEIPPSFSPDSKLVAFTGHCTNVWDLSLPVPQMISEPKTPFLKFAPQGQSFHTLEGDRLISLPWEFTKRGQFRLGSRTEIAKFPNILGGLWPKSLRPTGGRFINPQAEGKLQVWNLKDATQPLFEVQHPDQTGIQDFALSDDGDLLAAFTNGGKNLVWDLTETPPREYVLPIRNILNTHPFFTADGKLLIVARQGGIDIHDWAAGRLVRTIPFPGNILGLARHPDGQHLATVNGNGTVYILRMPELAEHHGQAK